MLSHLSSSCVQNVLHRVNGCPGRSEMIWLSEQDEEEDPPSERAIASCPWGAAGRKTCHHPHPLPLSEQSWDVNMRAHLQVRGVAYFFPERCQPQKIKAQKTEQNWSTALRLSLLIPHTCLYLYSEALIDFLSCWHYIIRPLYNFFYVIALCFLIGSEKGWGGVALMAEHQSALIMSVI